jgi:hypothetical protein
MEDGHPHPPSVEIDASRYNILLGTGPRFVLLTGRHEGSCSKLP